MCGRAAAALLLLLVAPARPAAAEEWYEAYQAGLAALKRGDNAGAAERLRRAIALRPEPGRNLVTYGTNVEARYFPYLRLAEASLALGQLDAARQALEASATWGREPAEDRQSGCGARDPEERFRAGSEPFVHDLERERAALSRIRVAVPIALAIVDGEALEYQARARDLGDV